MEKYKVAAKSVRSVVEWNRFIPGLPHGSSMNVRIIDLISLSL